MLGGPPSIAAAGEVRHLWLPQDTHRLRPPRGQQKQRSQMLQLTAATVKGYTIRPFRSGFSQGTQTTPQEDPEGPPVSAAS